MGIQPCSQEEELAVGKQGATIIYYPHCSYRACKEHRKSARPTRSLLQMTKKRAGLKKPLSKAAVSKKECQVNAIQGLQEKHLTLLQLGKNCKAAVIRF